MFLVPLFFFLLKKNTQLSHTIKLTHLKCSPAKALAGVAQWVEHWRANQRVAGSIPSQGTCLGGRPGPQLGVCKRQPHTDVSLPLFLSSPLSKNK